MVNPFHFSLTGRLMSEPHQSNKILIKKERMCLLLMFGPLSLSTLYFQILLQNEICLLCAPMSCVGKLIAWIAGFWTDSNIFARWALLIRHIFIVCRTKCMKKRRRWKCIKIRTQTTPPLLFRKLSFSRDTQDKHKCIILQDSTFVASQPHTTNKLLFY